MLASSDGIFLAQITVLLLAGRLLGELMQRFGQPSVMGELLAGVLLGPSVLGAALPGLEHALFPPGAAQRGMLDGVAELGVLMLLLVTGMEMDFSRVTGARRAALAASGGGIVVPFGLGFLLGELLPASFIPAGGHRLLTSLFLGTALAISSVKIVASVLRELDFMRRNVGQIILAAAIVDDTIGWILLSVILSFAQTGEVDALSTLGTVLSTLAFLAAAFILGRRAIYFVIRWANDHLTIEMPVITTTLVLMGLLGLLTAGLGVQTVLGAFVAGMLIGQSPILTRHIEQQLRGMVVALFMPVFFALAGLHTDLRLIASPQTLALAVAFIAVASLGKLAGAFAGGALGGLTRAESLALACGMNARGSTEIIMATIGLSVGALDTQLFTMIVFMAVVTTLMMPPMLRASLARIPITPQERARFDRDEFEARGFVAQLERVLLATDGSPSGRLASSLVGLLTAPRGMPVTALAAGDGPADPARAQQIESVRKAMERAVAQSTTEAPGDPPPEIDLIGRSAGDSAQRAVAREARKGHDLLVIGMEPLLTEAAGSGTTKVHPRTAAMAQSFGRAVCIVDARGRDAVDPVVRGRRILLPVVGSDYSRDAADLALALAEASGSSVTALAVALARGRATWRRRIARSLTLAEEAADGVLWDVLELSRHYAVHVGTVVGSRIAPEDAILRELARGHHDLIVLASTGVRPGDPAFSGSIPAAILERADCSLVLLAGRK